MERLRIGLDFGGVIVRAASANATEDTGLHEPGKVVDEALPGSIEGVSRLVDASDGNVWIVSKAGAKMQARTLQWLHNTGFYSQTGLSRDHVRVCVSREQKAPICTELAITHFMDDRVHVMQILRDVVPNLFLFQPTEEKKAIPGWATHVSNWMEATALILHSTHV
jgi:hypothetical protein